MAQPKRRWSKERTHLKRANWKIEAKNLSTCSNCSEPVLSHVACPNCGYYDNKQVVKVKTEKAD